MKIIFATAHYCSYNKAKFPLLWIIHHAEPWMLMSRHLCWRGGVPACKVSTVQRVVGEVDWGQVHPPPAPVMTPPSQHRVQTSWPNYIACLYLPLILPTQAINKYILQDQSSLPRAGGLCNTKPTHRFHASKSKLRFLFWSKTLININIPS